MIQFQRVFRFLALPMAVVMVWASLVPSVAHAALVTTEQAIAGTENAGDRARVMEFLSRGDVQNQMKELGIQPAEAMARVTSLSDAEIANIAGRLDELPAGKDVLTSAVGAILLVFLVLLLTDLLGLTDVYPFTKKGSIK